MDFERHGPKIREKDAAKNAANLYALVTDAPNECMLMAYSKAYGEQVKPCFGRDSSPLMYVQLEPLIGGTHKRQILTWDVKIILEWPFSANN